MTETAHEHTPQPIQVNGLTIDLDAFCIRSPDGTTTPLTPQERLLLRTLIDAGGRVVTMEELGRLAWGFSCGYSASAIWNCVSTLRRKLGDSASHPRYLLTVRPIGYRIESHPASEATSEPYTAEIPSR